MDEIAARPGPRQERVDGGVERSAPAGLVRQTFKYPGRSGASQIRPAAVGEFHCGKAGHGLGWAVPALPEGDDRFGVDNDIVGGDRRNRDRHRSNRRRVGDGKDAGGGTVQDVNAPGPIGVQLGDRQLRLAAVDGQVEPLLEEIPRGPRRRDLESEGHVTCHFEFEVAGDAPDGGGGISQVASIAATEAAGRNGVLQLAYSFRPA
jgi:hypothetical protein